MNRIINALLFTVALLAISISHAAEPQVSHARVEISRDSSGAVISLPINAALGVVTDGRWFHASTTSFDILKLTSVSADGITVTGKQLGDLLLQAIQAQSAIKKNVTPVKRNPN